MPVKCKYITSIIEKMAPSYLSADWDNIGLIIGDGEALISSVLISLDMNGDVLKEALCMGANLIITHHPVIFTPYKTLNSDNFRGKMLQEIIKNGINVYSAHTNLDAAEYGINDFLAKEFELTDVEVLKKTYEDKLYKLVVFVPKGYEDSVRDAMTEAGSGYIGGYSSCTFNISGTGTFMPLEGSNPFIGSIGKLEKVDEVRIEAIIDSSRLKLVIEKMLEAHPYEEVAYDIYPLYNKGKEYGFGRIGYLKSCLPLRELCQKTKQVLKVDSLNVIGNLDKEVRKVGVCSGSGAEFIIDAFNAGCDAYISGDIKYHDACDARDMGLSVIDAGHYATENIYMDWLFKHIKNEVESRNYDVDVILSKQNKNPYAKV